MTSTTFEKSHVSTTLCQTSIEKGDEMTLTLVPGPGLKKAGPPSTPIKPRRKRPVRVRQVIIGMRVAGHSQFMFTDEPTESDLEQAQNIAIQGAKYRNGRA